MAKLTQAERDALPASAFVFPSSRRYPIHDKDHAHAALIDSRGTKDEATVRAAVRARYGWDASNVGGVIIDLAGHYNPNQPRDSHGRWTSTGGSVRSAVGNYGGGPAAFMQRGTTKVKAKAPAYVVNGKGFDSGGHALTPMAPAKVRLREQLGNAYGEDAAAIIAQKHGAKPHSSGPGADLIPAGAHFGDVTAWYGKTDDTDKDNLSTDLGLDPKYRERSVKELRKAITDRKTKKEERAALKAELAKRVALAKATADAKNGFTNRLAKRLEDKPEDADIAPIIGETLAAHPQLGALAHVWDRLRLAGYNFRKKVKEGEFTDELPRILARTAFTVLAAFLMMHLGTAIPGLDFGTASGD